MLDTNILIYAIRHPQDQVVDKIIDHAGVDICISTITLAELELGILRSADPLKNRQALIAALSGIDILFFDNSAAAAYAVIKNQLMQAGIIIEDMDILIAAHASSLGYTIVTDNTKHFSVSMDC
jgi:tRNA(fMet)-specific endonuclease VapC